MSYKTKILTVMAAVAVVVMMLAVPLIVAVDTDADLTKDEKGFSITYKNPTEAQMPSEEKRDFVISSLMTELAIFNTGVFGDITLSGSDPVNITYALGQKIDSDSKTVISDSEVSADNVTITIKATDDGALIDPDPYMPKVYKDAAEAIKSVMGNEVSTGDTVTITGSMNVRMAEQEKTTYNLLDGNKCIKDKIEESVYYVIDINMVVTFKHGSAAPVSIKLFSDLRGMFNDDVKFEYESTPIQVGTKYVKKDTVSTVDVRGDTYYTVNDKDYSLVSTADPTPDVPGVVTALTDQSTIKVDQSLIDQIAALPAAADNITVDKTYGGAQSAFAGVVMDAVGNDILKIVLIIVGVVIGVIVLIVILIIVLIVLKKKKK